MEKKSLTKNIMTKEMADFLYKYDSENGVLLRNVTFRSDAVAGSAIGNIRPSYKGTSFCGRKIAWLMATGEFPSTPIACLDGDPKNLRMSNLIKTPTFTEFSEREIEDSKELIFSLISYNPDDGRFKWSATFAGKVKGSYAEWNHSHGYRVINVFGRSIYAHRLAFLFMEGKMPSKNVDHIDSIRNNNRWSNLRDVSQALNAQNLRLLRDRRTKSGLLGVHWSSQRGKWHAEIKMDKKKTHLGFFDDKEEAHAAYLEAKRKMHPGCTV